LKQVPGWVAGWLGGRVAGWLGVNCGVILGLFWGSFWGHFGFILGFILGSLWDRSGSSKIEVFEHLKKVSDPQKVRTSAAESLFLKCPGIHEYPREFWARAWVLPLKSTRKLELEQLP